MILVDNNSFKQKIKASALPMFFGIWGFFFMTSCDNAPQKLLIRGEAQGTTYAITYFDASGIDMKTKVDSLLLDIDYSLSTYRSNSIISKFNSLDSGAFNDLDTFGHFNAVLGASMVIHEQSLGAFDPTVKPLVDAWGFGLTKAEEMDSMKVDSLVSLRGFDTSGFILNTNSLESFFVSGKEKMSYIKRKIGLQIDFNAIAQGYSVDQIGLLFRSKGFENVLIEVGGEMLALGSKLDGSPWSVGIDRPTEGERELEAILDLKDEAIATSGNYRKFYIKDGVKYSHTIDPNSGFPVQHSLLSATVIAKDAATADALATVFMVMGKEKSIAWAQANRPEINYFLISSMEDGSFETTASEGLIAQSVD